MIREFIELHAAPGTLPACLHTGLRATEEAEALIEALHKTFLIYRHFWCRRCEKMRTFSFTTYRRANQQEAAEMVCDVCHSIAMTLHEAPLRT